MPETDPRAGIRARARELGFEAVGFARAELPESATAQFAEFLREERHGEMDWLACARERRSDPRVLWPEARSVVTLGMNYGPQVKPDIGSGNLATISVYAQGDDYHEVMKPKLKDLARFIAREYAAGVKVFVDTAPVMEKPLAQQAGLGWQGKHTNLVSREFGSWLFLGSVFTTLEIEPDAPEEDHCGNCRRCLDVCPTGAFTAPYRIDARRCISYLTIEHKSPIPLEFREAIGNRIYGCDDCLSVCPWNSFAVVARETRLAARAELARPPLDELAQLDDAGFRALFRKSAVKRIGRDRFMRNVLIAIGNSKDPALAKHARRLLRDFSPLVRGMAVWALARLLAPENFALLRERHLPREDDVDVRREWSRRILGCTQTA